MKLKILLTALTAVMALGSACQTPAEARRHYDARQATYNTAAYKRQLWEQNQAALMRRNREIQRAQRHGVDTRYNNYNNRDVYHNNRDNYHSNRDHHRHHNH